MRKINDGGPAFPQLDGVSFNDRSIIKSAGGASLRDWFAGYALMSMLNSPGKISDSTYAIAAKLSYKFADAMIAEREKGGE